MKRLNLGAGNRLIGGEGAVNHDLIQHRPEIDVTHDLNQLPWPWQDEEFEAVVAWAVLEHLEINLLQSIDEIWRILQPGGELTIKLPYWKHEDAYNDPTHRFVFGMGVFDVFDPRTRRGQHYDFYTDRKWKVMKTELTKAGTCIYGQMFKIGHEHET